jgi:hypothetical protein
MKNFQIKKRMKNSTVTTHYTLPIIFYTKKTQQEFTCSHKSGFQNPKITFKN